MVGVKAWAIRYPLCINQLTSPLCAIRTSAPFVPHLEHLSAWRTACKVQSHPTTRTAFIGSRLAW